MIISLYLFQKFFTEKHMVSKCIICRASPTPCSRPTPTPFLLKNSWEKKRHDIISRYTNNILRYQFQDIINIVMNATAMVKGQGCQESGAMYWAVPMRVNVLSAIFAKEPRSPTQSRYLDLQAGVHCQNFETMISLFFAPNFMLPWKAIELTFLHTTQLSRQKRAGGERAIYGRCWQGVVLVIASVPRKFLKAKPHHPSDWHIYLHCTAEITQMEVNICLTWILWVMMIWEWITLKVQLGPLIQRRLLK